MEYDLTNLNKNMAQEIKRGGFRNRVVKLTGNHAFFKQAADKFSFTIVPDEIEELNEPPYGCVMRMTRFYALINSHDDIVVQFLHTALHEWCEHEWFRTPTPKDIFTPIELDVLEEVYSQFVIYKINPDIHDWFPNSIRKYLEFKNIPPLAATDRVLAMLEHNASTEAFDALLDDLYASPLQVGTFARYISNCESLLTSGLRDLIQQYDDALNGNYESN